MTFSWKRTDQESSWASHCQETKLKVRKSKADLGVLFLPPSFFFFLISCLYPSNCFSLFSFMPVGNIDFFCFNPCASLTRASTGGLNECWKMWVECSVAVSSECGPRNQSISISWELFRSTNSQALTRVSAEPEITCLVISVLVLKGTLLYTEVWELVLGEK